MTLTNRKSRLILAVLFVSFSVLIYISIWSGAKALDVKGPSRMVSGPNNNLYILADDIIVIVAPGGNILSTLKLKSDMGIDEPVVDFFVEPNGELILGLANTGKILRYSATGKLIQTCSIAVTTPLRGEPFYFKFTKGPSGYFYLSDSYANSVKFFDSEWKEVNSIEIPSRDVIDSGNGSPSAEHGFNWPNRLLFAGLHLYVVDTNNQRIVRLAPDGSFNQTISSWGRLEETSFTRPTDLSVEGNNIYVINRKPNGDSGAEIFSIDIGTGERLKFDLSSPLLTAEMGNNKTLEPEDLFARSEDVLVSDQTLMKIFRFSKKGQFLGTFGEELAAYAEKRKSVYRWARIVSVVFMIILLTGFLVFYISQRSRDVRRQQVLPEEKPKGEREQSISVPDDKSVSFWNRKVSARTVLIVLLVIGVCVFLWIKLHLTADHGLISSHPLMMIYPLLMIVFAVAMLLLPILGLVILFRVLRKQSGRKYSKSVLAAYTVLVIILLGTLMSDRIIHVLPNAVSRPLSHILISLDMGDSNLYVKLSKNGDKSSIPCLIQALKSESSRNGFEDNYMADTILKGLRRITGNDIGSSYEDWEEWWDENKDKTAEQWWLDAVGREGYPVSGYPDADSIASIVEAMGFRERESHVKGYLLNNAALLLSKQPTEKVITVIEDKLRRETSAKFKMGAASALGSIGAIEGIPLLRTLTTADDLNVRNRALLELNQLHRKQMTTTSDSNIIHKIDAGYSITYMTGSPDKKSLYFATRADIRRLDLVTGKTGWSFKNSGEAGSELVIHDGRVLFYSFDGMVYCLDASTGRFLWKYQIAGPRPEYHSKITVLGDVAYLGIEDNVWAFEIKSGRVKWRLKAKPRPELISHSSKHIFVATTKDELLKISENGKVISRTQIGESPRMLAGDDNMLYVISFSEPAHFKIYSTESLSLLHDEPAGKGRTLSKAPFGDVIIVSEDKRVRAFDGKSGQSLWSTKEDDGLSVHFINKYLIVGDELRLPYTGEIVHKYNVPKVRRASLVGENCIMAADNGKLFIFRTPRR